jgi:integrase/recombinase XerD
MGTIQVIPGEAGQLIVHFSYSTERVAVIRAVPGRRWHPEGKYWTVPHTPETLERMRSLFSSDRVIVAAAVEAASEELPVARVTEVVTALDEELALRGYSSNTRNDYRLQVQRFLKWLQREPATASEENLRAYLLDILDSGLSTSYVRQARAALSILYRDLLNQAEKVVHIPSVKREKKLPLVLSKVEVQRLLKVTPNLREETF